MDPFKEAFANCKQFSVFSMGHQIADHLEGNGLDNMEKTKKALENPNANVLWLAPLALFLYSANRNCVPMETYNANGGIAVDQILTKAMTSRPKGKELL